MHKSGTLKGSLGLLRSSELFHWTVMQGKHSQKLCNSTETHWTLPTSIFFDVWEYTILITSDIKKSCFYFISGISCYFQLYRFDKIVIKIVFYIWGLLEFVFNCSGINISLFCFLFVNFLPLAFYNICYGTFLG